MNRIRAVIAIACVCSSLLSTDISAKNEQPVPTFHKIIHKTPQLQAKKKYKIGYINGTNIYIRTKPTTKSKHLSRMLMYGNKVKYKKVNSKWSSVKSKKMHFKGYIMTKYISPQKVLKKELLILIFHRINCGLIWITDVLPILLANNTNFKDVLIQAIMVFVRLRVDIV